MFRIFNRIWLAAGLLCMCGQSAFGFAGMGIFEPYQVPAIGYNLQNVNDRGLGDQNGATDSGGPKNVNQWYRVNESTLYYAFDASFANFFGPVGMAEVDKGTAVFNSLSNVSSYSTALTEFPLKSAGVNGTAQALGLLDLKSYTMWLILEQLGLGQSERWVWCLHDRVLPAGASAPNFEYTVIQRNFDPITKFYSSYVNNGLYGYSIVDFGSVASNAPPNLLADAIEYDVDPNTAGNFPVASGRLFVGGFYTGLTRDDMGGLRALYSKTNVFMESSGTNNNQAVPATTPTLLTTQNYSNLLFQATINNTAALTGLFPGLVVTSETVSNVLVVTTNTVAVLVPNPYAPVGNFTTTFVTTLTTNFQLRYTHTFGNVVPVHVYTNAFVTYQTTSVIQLPYAPFGNLTTNITTTTTVVQGITNGDFYILPTTLCDDYIFTTPGPIANVTTTVTAVPITNPNGVTTNAAPTANIITYFTNYTYSVFQVPCVANTVNLRGGLEKISFVRQDFDSILGTAWTPATNTYTELAVTNGLPVLQKFRRIIAAPDILFTTADLDSGPAAAVSVTAIERTSPNFNSSEVAANQFGPGTIQPAVTITFNNAGTTYINAGPAFVSGRIIAGDTVTSDANSLITAQWGSFNFSTNAPIVYPDSASLAALEAQIFFQITTSSPLVYSLSQPFSVTNTASGGSRFAPSTGNPPYLWMTNDNSLPAGLKLSTSGVLSGTLSGVTTNTPPIVFNVEAQDAGGRVTEAALTLVIVP